MKIVLFVFILSILTVLSGCCVIDFLDGKYYNQSPNYDRPQYNTNTNTGNGGGHSH